MHSRQIDKQGNIIFESWGSMDVAEEVVEETID